MCSDRFLVYGHITDMFSYVWILFLWGVCHVSLFIIYPPTLHNKDWLGKLTNCHLQHPPLVLSYGIIESQWGAKDDGKEMQGLMVNEVALLQQPTHFLQFKNNFVAILLWNGPFLINFTNVSLDRVFHTMTSTAGCSPPWWNSLKW